VSDPRIQAIATGDFVTRSRAAGALVREGEPALAVLGRAGPLEVVVHGRTTVSATRPLIAEILAKVPEDRLVSVWIPCPWPVVREGAAEEAGHRSAWTAVPALIARLEDPVPEVRTAAALALRRVTNRVDAGVPATPEEGRILAASWRTWWDREGRLRAPTPSRTPSG
jgi:hypothetical protein